jgi:hypothetical protein
MTACRGCAHWRKNSDEDFGACLRFPPRISDEAIRADHRLLASDSPDEPPVLISNDTIAVASLWPITSGADRCGEHSPGMTLQ